MVTRVVLVTSTLAAWSACEPSAPTTLDGGASTSEPATATSTVADDPGRGAEDLQVTLDGEPVKLRSARAFTRGNRTIDIVFSSLPELACDEGLLRFGARGDEVRFGLRLHQHSDDKGEQRWVASRSSFGTGSLADMRQVEVSAAGARRGERVSATIDLSLRGVRLARAARGTSAIEVRGSFEAIGCGDFPLDAGDATRQSVRVDVAGERFPILDARVRHEENGRRTLVLTSQPNRCDADMRVRPDVLLAIGLDATGTSTTELGVAGDRFDGSITASSDEIVRLSNVREANGRWQATVEANEEFDGARVVISGAIDATVCPSRP